MTAKQKTEIVQKVDYQFYKRLMQEWYDLGNKEQGDKIAWLLGQM